MNRVDVDDKEKIIANMTYEEASRLALTYVQSMGKLSFMEMMGLYVDTLQDYLQVIQNVRENINANDNSMQDLPSNVIR